MNFSYQSDIPAEFADEARVWIYQSSRPFGAAEAAEISGSLAEFVAGWQSHGDPVAGFGHLFFDRFIVLMADESKTGVSGCSTDGSVRLIKSFEEKYGLGLFNRQSLAFVVNDQIQIVPVAQFDYALERGFLHNDTPYFDNTVLTKSDFVAGWIKPIGKSWLGQKFVIPL